MRHITFCLVLLLVVPQACIAGLVITFQEVQTNRVQVSWSGSGVILPGSLGSSGTGTQLEFDAFTNPLNILAGPFRDGISQVDIIDPGFTSGISQFALSIPLQLSINSGTPNAFINSYTSIRLDNRNFSDNVFLVGDLTGDGQPMSLFSGDTYEALPGTALVEMEQLAGSTKVLSFLDLEPGSYDASTTIASADATVFGGVKLHVLVAVPEPSAWAFGGLVCGVSVIAFAVSKKCGSKRSSN